MAEFVKEGICEHDVMQGIVEVDTFQLTTLVQPDL